MAAIIFKGLVGRLKKDMLKGENDDINPSSLLSYEEVHFIDLSCKIFVETCIKIFMVLLLAFVMLYMSTISSLYYSQRCKYCTSKILAYRGKGGY